jgi:hypothetical protein
MLLTGIRVFLLYYAFAHAWYQGPYLLLLDMYRGSSLNLVRSIERDISMNKLGDNRLEQAEVFILFPSRQHLWCIGCQAIQMREHHVYFVSPPRMDRLKQNICIRLVNTKNRMHQEGNSL